jgi:hypothetical protein
MEKVWAAVNAVTRSMEGNWRFELGDFRGWDGLLGAGEWVIKGAVKEGWLSPV